MQRPVVRSRTSIDTLIEFPTDTMSMQGRPIIRIAFLAALLLLFGIAVAVAATDLTHADPGFADTPSQLVPQVGLVTTPEPTPTSEPPIDPTPTAEPPREPTPTYEPPTTTPGPSLPIPLPTTPGVAMIPGGAGTPTDPNADGLYDDVNGNMRKDFGDVALFFNQLAWIAEQAPVSLFDYNKNGRIDFADVVTLFDNL